MKKRAVFIAAILFALSCKVRDYEDKIITPFGQKAPQEVFAEKEIAGVYTGGLRIWEFDKTRHQFNFDHGSNCFSLVSDDLSRILSVVLPQTLVENAQTTITVSAAGLEGLTAGSKTVTVLKTDGSQVWLWDVHDEIGYIILNDL